MPIWRRLRDCFRRIETVAVADNYHRSVLGLPPAPYPEILPTQNQLQTNSTDYLTAHAKVEVGEILRIMERAEMYPDGADESTQSTRTAPRTPSSQQRTPLQRRFTFRALDKSSPSETGQQKTSTVGESTEPTIGFRPVQRPPSTGGTHPPSSGDPFSRHAAVGYTIHPRTCYPPPYTCESCCYTNSTYSRCNTPVWYRM